MKITYNWLAQYVDFDWPPEELGKRLTMLGLEVEKLERVGGGYEGVVVAEVLSREPHPNADRLSVCRVSDGKGERQIICGATNFKPGDKVPLILPGNALPMPSESGKPQVIKAGKIRGIASEGMLCSGKELGVSEDADGLMILDSKAQAGRPFANYLGVESADYVLDLEVTPNRPDWNSVIGIAREVGALTGGALKLPSVELEENGDPMAESVPVRIEDAALCPRYSARLIRNVKVGPSPCWMRSLLERIGIRSINNVVDAANFVMMETGQPLHAFDYRQLAGWKNNAAIILVRKARDGESFVTLDGRKHQLPREAVVIADEEKALALGGIMGGLNSEISESTQDVLLESACFLSQNIRSTSKKLGIRTDASYRFERGADPEIVDWASRRASGLICKASGGVPQVGAADAYPNPPAPIRISLRYEKTNRLLGVEIPGKEQASLLQSLGLREVATSEISGEFWVPSFRMDLKREVDLIEEVARLYGADRIPATPPRGTVGLHEHDKLHDGLALVRQILIGQGLHEIQAQTLISDQAAGIPSGLELLALEHPLSSDMNVLRPSLLPGLVEALRHNANHGLADAALFETGSVFCLRNGQPAEEERLALALTGSRFPLFWKKEKETGDFDLFDLKGRLEILLETLGVQGAQWRRAELSESPFVEEGSLSIGKQVIGRFGQMRPLLTAHLDLKKPVFLAELDLKTLLTRRRQKRPFQALPVFPSARRDAAMLVDESISHADVLRAVKKAKPDFLQTVELFDVFRGKGIPEGKKSIAYAFVYRHRRRTLKDEEVATAHAKITRRLQDEIAAEIR